MSKKFQVNHYGKVVKRKGTKFIAELPESTNPNTKIVMYAGRVIVVNPGFPAQIFKV